MKAKTKKPTKTNQTIAKLIELKLMGTNPKLAEWLTKIVTHCPNATNVEISFSGSGDSGDIDEVDIDPTTKEEWDALSTSDWDSSDVMVYELIDNHVTCDWVNNEGGGGVLKIDLTTLNMEVTSYYYERTETDCDAQTVSLLEGKE